MNITVQALITSINSLVTNVYSNDNKLEWINDLEQSIYSEIIDKVSVKYYSLQQNVTQYDFPAGITIDDIEKVYVQNREYYKLDSRHNRERGYWEENGKINIYPIPTISDTVYESGAGELTFTTNTITTTGDDFSGFMIGDIVTISGCSTESSNNKTAQIVSVSPTVLTFVSDSFTEAEEAGEVTISENSMKVAYRYLPAEKEIADIAEDTLLLPRQFKDLYEYYIFAKIAYFDQETEQYSNHMRMYNTRLQDFKDWYNDHRALYSDTEIESRLDYYETTSDYDEY